MIFTEADLPVTWDSSYPLEQFRDDHLAALEAWKIGEPAPAIHRPVARIAIDPMYTDVLTDDIAAIGEQTMTSAGKYETDILRDLRGYPISDMLGSFITHGTLALRNVIDAETGQGGNTQISALVGPYKPNGSDYSWHRDMGDAPHEDTGWTTYTLPLIGPTTVFTNADLRYRYFNGGYILDRYRHCIKDEVRYPPGQIMMHSGLVSAHRAPGPAHKGTPRLFLRAFVEDVLSAR